MAGRPLCRPPIQGKRISAIGLLVGIDKPRGPNSIGDLAGARCGQSAGTLRVCRDQSKAIDQPGLQQRGCQARAGIDKQVLNAFFGQQRKAYSEIGVTMRTCDAHHFDGNRRVNTDAFFRNDRSTIARKTTNQIHAAIDTLRPARAMRNGVCAARPAMATVNCPLI